MGLDQIFGKNFDHDEADERMLRVQEVKTHTLDELERLKDENRNHLAIAVSRGISTQRQQLTKWAKKMWSEKPGILHKH
eukprot:8203914-Pyramimonas_sp.AAC.1